MKRIKTALACLSVWVLLIWMDSGAIEAQEIFKSQLMTPNGISITVSDDENNVNIHSEGISTTLLTTFAPDGSQLQQTLLGDAPIDFLRFVESYLAADPDPLVDRLYVLSPEGDLVVFAASTLQEIGRFNIHGLTMDTNNVYDVATASSTSTFALSPFAIFGDIAAFRPNDDLNTPAWFVTGLSEGRPFVMRIPMRDFPSDVMEAQVILMSTLVPPLTLQRARGVAINAQGVGLTTLPVPDAIRACPDVVISFSATAPSLSQSDVLDLAGAAGVPSWGMDADSSGFYLVTGGVGNADCLQGGSGRLVFIADILTGIDTIVPLSSFPTGRPGDVGVSSFPDNSAYVTFPNLNTVGRVPGSALQFP